MNEPRVYETDSTEEIALLVGMQKEGETALEAEQSLAELGRLVESAGATVREARVIRLRRPDPATFISKGHLEALTAWAEATECDFVALDEDVSPVQQRNLEKAFGGRVLTRTEIILDIFATHAKTRESMTQVELAQLRYRMSRLVGMPIATARMGGARSRIATRGPGETQLEVDRRRVRQRVQHLESVLKVIERQRATQRRRRMRAGVPLVGIAGYTNAGKSTLLNQLTQAGVLAEDKLFATLDTTVRTLNLPGGLEVGLIDTVGFVNKLPHDLVAAFHATLEEIAYADVILHVVDSTSPRLDVEFAATEEIFKAMHCEQTPRLLVWNKTDLIEDSILLRGLMLRAQPAVAISALDGTGIPSLLVEMERLVLAQGVQMVVLAPYDQFDLVSRLHREGRVLESRDTPEGRVMRCRVSPEMEARLQPWKVDPELLEAPMEESDNDDATPADTE